MILKCSQFNKVSLWLLCKTKSWLEKYLQRTKKSVFLNQMLSARCKEDVYLCDEI